MSFAQEAQVGISEFRLPSQANWRGSKRVRCGSMSGSMVLTGFGMPMVRPSFCATAAR
jgi:hypothetical protein